MKCPEGSKLIEVSSPMDGLHSRISSDKSAALGEYLATIVSQFRVFDGRFGFQLGRKSNSST